MLRQRNMSLLTSSIYSSYKTMMKPSSTMMIRPDSNQFLPYQQFYFGARIKHAFGTERPQQSAKYHKGLYHLKTHGQRRQRCFSMKYSLVTMKPNVMRRSFFSQILNMHLRVWVSMKARKCIIKRGSFDNYIMKTKPKQLDSKFGIYIKQLMKQKIKDPQFQIPVIPGHSSQ